MKAAEPTDPVLLGSMPGELTIHGWQNLLIATWPRRTEADAVRHLARAREAFIREHPEGTSLIHLVLHSQVPDDATEAAMIDMMKRCSDGLACIGVVTLAEGFRASRVRSRTTTMRMVEAPGSFKMRYHASVQELIEWLPDEHRQRTGVSLAPATLKRFLNDLTAQAAG